MSKMSNGIALSLFLIGSVAGPGAWLTSANAQETEKQPPYEFKAVRVFNVIYRLPNGGGKVVKGELDAEGNFVRDEKVAPWSPAPGICVAINDPTSSGTPLPYGTKDQPQNVEVVYEYRSGSLVPGQLETTGNFVPRVGDKVIDIKDYVPEIPGRHVPRIYNLPGKFVKKPAGAKDE